MAKNPYGYVIVKWEIEPSLKPKGYRGIKFSVMDASLEQSDKVIGTLKMYGKKIPKNLLENIGKAVTDAQYYQRNSSKEEI